MTFQQLLASEAKKVTVLSYGYTEKSKKGSTFKTFKKQTKITFEIEEDILYHSNFMFDHKEYEHFFLRDGKIFCNDPSISIRI